jgi:hypothetical protein
MPIMLGRDPFFSARARDGRVTRGPSNGHARACNNEFGVAKEGVAAGASDELDVGMSASQFVEAGRSFTCVGDSHTSTHSFGPSDDGEAGVTRAKNNNAFVMPFHLAAPSPSGKPIKSNTGAAFQA